MWSVRDVLLPTVVEKTVEKTITLPFFNLSFEAIEMCPHIPFRFDRLNGSIVKRFDGKLLQFASIWDFFPRRLPRMNSKISIKLKTSALSMKTAKKSNVMQ